MPEPFKERLNYNSLKEFALAVRSVLDSFPVDKFLDSILDETWPELELKERGRRVSLVLGRYLPADFPTAIEIIVQLLDQYNGFCKYCFPDFVEVFGQDEENWNLSIQSLERFTEYASSELAVRPFIIKDEKRMMAQMYAWSKSDCEHVRRLSSEGCRPALPWGIALNSFKKDPTPILPILEQLKTDQSLDVRRSVANNLNDISKTHPALVISLAHEWYGQNKDTDWIIKHACRTLLKKGEREILALFGYEDITSVAVTDLSLSATSIRIGENLTFSFTLCTSQETKVRLEYAVSYIKANGKSSDKVFQISETTLKKGSRKTYHKKHSFADVTVRKHYSGKHSITLIVNGEKIGKLDFELAV